MGVPSKELLFNEYVINQLAMKKVSVKCGCAVGTVYNYLIKYGIPIRKKSEYVPTNETREKLSAASRNRIHQKHSEEAKIKMSKSKMGKFKAPTKYGGHKKLRSDGYIAVYVPGHPNSNKDHYVAEHVLVMEELIGRYLNQCEVVHHINRIRNDNRIENLQLMTIKEHMSFHMKERHIKERMLAY